jgi:hypothetical protein
MIGRRDHLEWRIWVSALKSERETDQQTYADDRGHHPDQQQALADLRSNLALLILGVAGKFIHTEFVPTAAAANSYRIAAT